MKRSIGTLFKPVFEAFRTFHELVLVLACSGILFLSGNIDIIRVFLQVESKNYCGSLKAP